MGAVRAFGLGNGRWLGGGSFGGSAGVDAGAEPFKIPASRLTLPWRACCCLLCAIRPGAVVTKNIKTMLLSSVTTGRLVNWSTGQLDDWATGKPA